MNAAQLYAVFALGLVVVSIVLTTGLGVALPARLGLAAAWILPFGIGWVRGVAAGDLDAFCKAMGTVYLIVFASALGRPLVLMWDFLPPEIRANPKLQKRRRVGTIVAGTISMPVLLVLAWRAVN